LYTVELVEISHGLSQNYSKKGKLIFELCRIYTNMFPKVKVNKYILPFERYVNTADSGSVFS